MLDKILSYRVLNLFPLIVFSCSLFFMLLILSKARKNKLYNRSSTKLILLGMMSGLSSIFQSSPVFLPVIGMTLSPFSTLPVAIGTILFPKHAFLLYFSTAVVTSFFSLQEAIIFILTTGPVGLGTALLLIQGKIKWSRLLIPIFALSSGIFVLTYVIGLEGMSELFNGNSVVYIGLGIILFSTIYTLFWTYILVIIKKRLNI